MQRLKIGDLVQVTTGRNKGKQGRVTKLTGDRVVVEGVNTRVRHTRPSQQNTEGGRIEFEAPLHVSNVMPIDSESGKPTRIKIVSDDDGKRRVATSGSDLK